MFNVRKRLGASILLTLLSIVSICLLLPSSQVKQLQIVTLGTAIEYSDLWKWGGSDLVEDEEDDNGNGIRLVILGDSWVDDWVEEGQDGKGNNWPHGLCDEVCPILLEDYYIIRYCVRLLTCAKDQLHFSPQFCGLSTIRCLAFITAHRSHDIERDPRMGSISRPNSAKPRAKLLIISRSGFSNTTIHRPATTEGTTFGDNLYHFLWFLGYLRLRTTRLCCCSKRYRYFH